MANVGHVLPIDIQDEMKKSYIDYAMSVIVSRALPDVRDGLKPVHRRILYAMNELSNTPNHPYKKSARIVGEVLGRYHPHGDVAVYDAMVRMAQDFSIRYPLVDGHGNFGSMDGDSPAAMRYTEVRLSPIAMEMLVDIDKETVDFIPNFDETTEEPVVLPARIPNLLINGSSGIAVGMATNIPPHNLTEVAHAAVYLIDHPEATLEDLLKHIPGPDFPTGGMIMGREGIHQAYATGRGIIVMRGIAKVDESDTGRSRIIISEIPYQVNKARLLEKIAELVHEHKIEGIADLRDESDRHGVRIVIDLKRDGVPKVILNKLYKYTPLQQTFGIILLALVDNRPQVLSLKEILHYFIAHRKEIIVRRTQYDLKKAEARAHILEGLRIALQFLDEVIALIRGSSSVDQARSGLMERFGLSELQANAILEMRLQRLTQLEQAKIEEEYQQIQALIAHLREILADERLVYQIIKDDLVEIQDKYGDERRTKIGPAVKDMSDEDLIPEEDMVVTLTHRGYIKRSQTSVYRAQKRGGRGVTGSTVREDDFINHLFIASTHAYLCFFTNKGRIYRVKVHEVPEASRQAKGISVANLIAMEADERIAAVQTLPQTVAEDSYWVFATKQGVVKRTALSDYSSWRGGGIIAINLDPGDELIGVEQTSGQSDILLATAHGQVIRFNEELVRAMGRSARGVRGIHLRPGDRVVSLAVVSDQGELLLLTENGYGKRTSTDQFRVTGRGGQGVLGLRITAKTGQLVGIVPVEGNEQCMVISSDGTLIRMDVSSVSKQGRDSRGVLVMRLEEGQTVAAFTRVSADDENEESS
ncbi:DNA gyrase subunit A [Sulfobacillus thermosulfidooxidans]|uniref:DNA gyrase subunit A n=1 Tax=Sulfobacillus thermosulfidooxidans TaxID=28034 RepID=UPI000300D127|nr:DNA gyrase subunit A [Sulfobacillus thermosulfidooxidans]OLZ08987.1 DNA gyrase subunit A [Sulfobacillus thermosulfidooxidans]OLZ14173.1 DNA gyrase subunit A [Sulfobacillus thermosulfidooxidans]OLZ18916.1 DNA gyrase subunit A [Sulfobacillus thermosulfidooxidans]